MNGSDVAATTSSSYVNLSSGWHRPGRLAEIGYRTDPHRPPERPQEKPLKSWNYYILESESCRSSSEGEDTTLSIQGKETDLARDTSDLEWDSSEEEEVNVEYEIGSDSSKAPEDGFIDSNCSSGSDDDIITTTTIKVEAIFNDADLFTFADSEDSLTAPPTDTERFPFRYVDCAQCGKPNSSTQMFRYCDKCYKVRKDIFPPRPKRRRPKRKTGSKRQRKSSLQQNWQQGKHGREEISSGEGIHEISSGEVIQEIINVVNDRKRRSSESDSDANDVKKVKRNSCEITVIKNSVSVEGIATETCKAESVIDVSIPIEDKSYSFSQPLFSTFNCEDVELITKTLSDPALTLSHSDVEDGKRKHYSDNDSSNLPLGGCDLSTDAIHTNVQANFVKNIESDMCIMCLVEPKSGIFVHGRIAHICCCYKCSVKCWTKTKRCPICKCKVSNVLRAFFT